jgi:site-specific DNA recombinase
MIYLTRTDEDGDCLRRLISRELKKRPTGSGRRVELTDLETISHYVEDLHDLLKEGSLTERRAFIRSFVREVRVTGYEAVLTYSMPLLPEKVAIEKEGVLPTVRYGGRYRT